jgi:hypothetical protein
MRKSYAQYAGAAVQSEKLDGKMDDSGPLDPTIRRGIKFPVDTVHF